MPRTIYDGLRPIITGAGDICEPQLVVPSIDGKIDIDFVDATDRLHLLPGDLRLSKFEDDLSEN